MKMISVRTRTLLLLALCLVALAGCGGASSGQASVPTQPAASGTEQPVPVGGNNQVSGSDIPDTQVFVTYASPSGGYQLEVPEGWAQTTQANTVSFVSNLNMLQVTLSSANVPPTATSVRNDIGAGATWQQAGRAVRDVQVSDIQLSNGPAVLITFSSNSDPNPVTNKQVRLENNRYLVSHQGKLATLTLSAPVGADNRDQWMRIANSFKWV